MVEQDFQLGSGDLSVDPDALSADVPMGETADLTLTISNEGTAAAEFEITERDLGFEILGLDGAPAQRIGGTFSPLSVLAAPADGARRGRRCPGPRPTSRPGSTSPAHRRRSWTAPPTCSTASCTRRRASTAGSAS